MSFADKAREWLTFVNWSDDDGFDVAEDVPNELVRALDELAIGEHDSIRGRFFVDALRVVDEQDLTAREARAQAGDLLNGPIQDLFGRYIQKRMQDDSDYFEQIDQMYAEPTGGSLTETARRVMAMERQGVLTSLSEHYEQAIKTEQNEVTEHE